MNQSFAIAVPAAAVTLLVITVALIPDGETAEVPALRNVGTLSEVHKTQPVTDTVREAVNVAPVAFAEPIDFTKGKRTALLVGISQYSSEELGELPGAEPDVAKLAHVLQRNGFARESVVVMTNRSGAENPKYLPTAAKIRKQLRRLTENCQPEDSILIALAGHGLQPRGGEYSFCPQDTELDDPQPGLAISEIYDVLTNCRAGFKVLFIDACREDTTRNPSHNSGIRSVTRSTQARLQNLPEPPARTAAFFSCSPGQLAYERHDGDETHGVFFHAIIRGIEGAAAGENGKVTLPDLERFVMKDVESFVRQTYSASQQPVMRNNSVGLVPLVAYSKRQRELERADYLWVRGRRDEALDIVRQLAAKFPQDGLALAVQARMEADWAEEENDTNGVRQSLELAEQAIQLAPARAEPFVARASIRRTLGEYELAMEDCNRAIQLDAECARAYMERAALHQQQQSSDAMLQDIETACKLEPEEPTARTLYAAMLFFVGRMDDGFEQVDYGLTKNPDVPLLHFMKGYGLDQQKNYDKAILAYTAAIRLDDRDDDLYCRRAVSLANAGDFPGANDDVRKAEELDPQNTDIIEARVVILVRQQKYGEAIRLLDQAIAKHPGHPEWEQHRSTLRKALGR